MQYIAYNYNIMEEKSMKNKLVKAMATAMVMVTGCMLIACGGAKKPSGTYENDGVSLNFGSKTVIVSEGKASEECAYEIDSEGNISFELEGDPVTCTYDAEHDIIRFLGEKYTK